MYFCDGKFITKLIYFIDKNLEKIDAIALVCILLQERNSKKVTRVCKPIPNSDIGHIFVITVLN